MTMTKKELSQYYWLSREIEDMENRLRDLRARAASPASPNYSGMPKSSGGAKDRLAEAAADIADLEAIIAAKRIESIHAKSRIERYIYTIDDPMTRIVFTLRCIDGHSWREVALKMGHDMTEENARQIFRRSLRAAQQTGYEKNN